MKSTTKWVDLTVKGFNDELLSESPSPGGGSVSPLSVALGTTLGIMVTHLTTSKKKYAEYENKGVNIREDFIELNEKLIQVVD